MNKLKKSFILIFFLQLTNSSIFAFEPLHVLKILMGHKDLQDLDLSKADLKGYNLSFANLSNTNLSGANLEGANLKQAIVQKTNFENANMQKVNLSYAYVKNAKFKNTDLRNSIIIGINPIYLVNHTNIKLKNCLYEFCKNDKELIFKFLSSQNLRMIISIKIPSKSIDIVKHYYLFIDFSHKLDPTALKPLKKIIKKFRTFFEKMLQEKISFKNNNIHFDKKIIYRDKCPICFNNFIKAQEIAIFICGHTFCKDCANKLLSKQRKCPICRQEPIIGYKSIHFWE